MDETRAAAERRNAILILKVGGVALGLAMVGLFVSYLFYLADRRQHTAEMGRSQVEFGNLQSQAGSKR